MQSGHGLHKASPVEEKENSELKPPAAIVGLESLNFERWGWDNVNILVAKGIDKSLHYSALSITLNYNREMEWSGDRNDVKYLNEINE